MRLIYPNCDAEYQVDDAAIPDGGRDVQCSNCGHAWFQLPAGLEAALADEDALFGAVEGMDGYSCAEIGLICRDERVSKLEDIVLRRTLMAFEGIVTRQGLKSLGATVAACLGWSDRQREDEIAATHNLLQDRHRMTIR